MTSFPKVSSGDPLKSLRKDLPTGWIILPRGPHPGMRHTGQVRTPYSHFPLESTFRWIFSPLLTPLSDETPVNSSGLNPCGPRPSDRQKYPLKSHSFSTRLKGSCTRPNRTNSKVVVSTIFIPNPRKLIFPILSRNKGRPFLSVGTNGGPEVRCGLSSGLVNDIQLFPYDLQPTTF